MGHFQLRPSRYRSVLTGISVAALSLAIADRATAQVTATGSNFPSPVVSGTTDNYYIGSGGTGTLSILGGSSFTAGSLGTAAGMDRETGNGTITIDGSGTTVTLNPQGTTNILQPGNLGVGSVHDLRRRHSRRYQYRGMRGEVGATRSWGMELDRPERSRSPATDRRSACRTRPPSSSARTMGCRTIWWLSVRHARRSDPRLPQRHPPLHAQHGQLHHCAERPTYTPPPGSI